MNSPEWVQESQASEALGISVTTLRQMRREERLRPGIDWIYTTGKVNGSVLYDLGAVRQWQRENTIRAFKEQQEKASAKCKKQMAAIETFEEV